MTVKRMMTTQISCHSPGLTLHCSAKTSCLLQISFFPCFPKSVRSFPLISKFGKSKSKSGSIFFHIVFMTIPSTQVSFPGFLQDLLLLLILTISYINCQVCHLTGYFVLVHLLLHLPRSFWEVGTNFTLVPYFQGRIP